MIPRPATARALPTGALSAPLIDRLLPLPSRFLRVPLQIAAGVTVLALLAQLEVTLGPVPLTGQTLGVLLIGAAYGLSLGTLTLLAYLAVGTAGFGVFAGGGAGWATLTGATAGYLVGFVLAAALVGYLAQRGWTRSFSATALAMLLGNVLIYVPGLLWLRQILPDWPTTLSLGLLPFIPGDLIKLALAAALLPTAWTLLGRPKG